MIQNIISNKVSIIENNSHPIDLYVNQKFNNPTLSQDAILDSNFLNFNTGHLIVVGNYLSIQEGERIYQGKVINVDGDIITMSIPLDFAFTTETLVIRTNINANLDGSDTPIIFNIRPQADQIWDITRIMFFIEDGSAMDSTKFGGINALNKGILIRKTDGIYNNIFDFRSNGELANRSFDLLYDDKTGGGLYSLRARKSFNGPDKNGVVIRLDGNKNEELQMVIQDDLTGLVNFNLILQGHVAQE